MAVTGRPRGRPTNEARKALEAEEMAKLPPQGSTEALLADLALAKKELISLSALCDDNASKLKFAESIRKLTMSEIDLKAKNSKIVAFIQEQQTAESVYQKEALKDVYEWILNSLDDSEDRERIRFSLTEALGKL